MNRIKRKMKKRDEVGRQSRSFVCCICRAAIYPNAEPCCTLSIKRGLPGWKQHPDSKQQIWAHGVCLRKLIPITEYSFPEPDLSFGKYPMYVDARRTYR